VNNDNSSRFGKFVQLRFDQSGVTAGAVITNYLLEKSRITHHAEGERTYHIMYQLYAACNDDMREDLFLTDHPSTFKILNPLPPGWGDSAESMKADAEGFEEVKAALWDMGDSQFSHALKTTIWQIVSAILHLGNVSFEDETIGDGEAATHTESSKVAPSDAELLKQTCDLLGLSDPTQLAKALVTRTVTSGSGASRRGSQYTVPVTAVRAKDTADALGKQLYSKLFDLIVQCVNKSISGTDPSECLPNFVGLLDIYGFEVFEFNSFEQLCINFANEKLQQLFVAHVFKFEEAEYASEGIDFAAAVHYVGESRVSCTFSSFGFLVSLPCFLFG
jgi:myosin heavy subunit